MTAHQNKVWGVFVGEKGYQLEAFNSLKAPFPPEPNAEGYIAIGWPAVGDMNLYEGGYADYLLKFRKVYSTNNAAQANAVWNFAFVMKEGDWVISPSAASGCLLVGKIISGYIPDFHNESGLYKVTSEVYLHLRKVQWLYTILKSDPRYSKLNKIGVLTVVQPNISVEQLNSILNTNVKDTWSDELLNRTRVLLDEGFVPNGNFLYMKNINGSYGEIQESDLKSKIWRIQDRKTETENVYTTLDELIDAGWVAD